MTSSEKSSGFSLVHFSGRSGSVKGRHYRDGALYDAAWENGVLTALKPALEGPSGKLWLAPALIDLQVNGYAGVDFQSDAFLNESALLKVVRALRRDGCQRVFLTLITSPWEDLRRRVVEARRLIQANEELKAAFCGWHIEGPFLSDQPGFRGAHNPAWTSDPTAERIRELKSWVHDDSLLLTLAPERAGSVEAIREAVACGFRVSFGHSDASAAVLSAAADAGGSAFTHLGNGCPQALDRHDNIIWRVINESRLNVGLIPDAIHISPALFRIFHRAMPPERVYWTTDAMAAAGAPPGRYTLGAVELAVGEDRVVRNPATGGFAGSALEPIEGIRRGAAMLGCRWQEAWDFFSVHPARLMGLPHGLEIGSPAGFCLIEEH